MSGHLTWKTQFASYDRTCADLLHFATGRMGQFEVFETGDHFLLHFPSALRRPSELFDSLDAAKTRADEFKDSDYVSVPPSLQDSEV